MALRHHRDRRFSGKHLDAVIQVVTSRLNPVVEPAVRAWKPWPYEAWVDAGCNCVIVILGRAYRGWGHRAQAALADVPADGSARLYVGDAASPVLL